MPQNQLREIVIRFLRQLSVAVGLIGGVITIAMVIQDVNKWYIGAISISLLLLVVILCFLLADRISKVRELFVERDSTFDIFLATHNSWHMYKRLMDQINKGELNDVQEFLAILRKDIANLIADFRHAITLLHPLDQDTNFRVSLKFISYKDRKKLNNPINNN
ncbi:MAG: hypothetical protein D3903_18000 [Candidatus Electrothrix sp. GM3_4]|nr:hypothetical protein [Candidatus Electrothrix sp. GM3_4]